MRGRLNFLTSGARMRKTTFITVDGNEATALIAHKCNEVIVIYPITPSSTMGELCDEWSANGRQNLWGAVPEVTEMQSEAGAAGAVHGALQVGALATTFTASQGLLLMIPNLYKIAGEFTPFCMHVAARTLATHALSIFGDHSDVMACRQTGFALLASGSVQEAHDFAAMGQAATLLARVPFMHFFDGFRTSHEVAKIAALHDDDLRALLDPQAMAAHRARALTPDHPSVRGTAQNPDAFFQAREAGNQHVDAVPGIVKHVMAQFAERTGRTYQPFDYFGHPDAQHVVVVMGSGAETVRETVAYLNARGQKLGVVQVRLYRPFSVADFAAVLPATTERIAVLDRTKEPGAPGEPLYLDVVAALAAMRRDGFGLPREPMVVGGRYGLSSKEFTPAMVDAVFRELQKAKPRHGFTVGIMDDVTFLSLDVDPGFSIEAEDVVGAVFFGLGSDGTVGANKNSIKIIGEETALFAQGYFVYDSKKSGAMTISHLRFGPRPIRAPYLVKQAHFVACHHVTFLDKYDVLGYAAPGGVFLLNSAYSAAEIWHHLSAEVQAELIDKRLTFYVIDAHKVAQDTGMGGRINTIMQTCFFAISGVLPRDEAIGHIKHAIEKSYKKKGADIVQKNFAAVDETLAHLEVVHVPGIATSSRHLPPIVDSHAPDFVQRVTAVMMADKGDALPVSAFPLDGVWPMGTTQWEKRNIALAIPVWHADVCIQCNKCALVCPHAAIRAKVFAPSFKDNAPPTFKAVDYKGLEFRGDKYTIQVAPEDCTGCELCVHMCPAVDKKTGQRALEMAPQPDLRAQEHENFAYFLTIPEPDRQQVKIDVKGSQFLQPLFEFSGACAGCGETPYVKLLTQLFGDRLLIANATGCSSIFGGNLPTTPYTTNLDGRGPAWANSLFEDNAEFGLGFRLAVDQHAAHAKALVQALDPDLAAALLNADQSTEQGLAEQRARVAELKTRLLAQDSEPSRRLWQIADFLVKKSVWIVGGDGWAYDIGYGGLDHVLASGRDVNVLVLDTEVYSNTGGQASKATPMGAAARFATAGKASAKKDLGLMAMSYGHVYIARVALGAKDAHTVRALQEAESYPGPSLVIAYSHCIAHGYDLSDALEHQETAVQSAYWPLYRYDPRRRALGENPLKLDSPPPKRPLADFVSQENRFKQTEARDPKHFAEMMLEAQDALNRRYALYEYLSKMGAEK
jgi:pyruvate-ferredoxin/flavodoxin oxidoreductase